MKYLYENKMIEPVGILCDHPVFLSDLGLYSPEPAEMSPCWGIDLET